MAATPLISRNYPSVPCLHIDRQLKNQSLCVRFRVHPTTTSSRDYLLLAAAFRKPQPDGGADNGKETFVSQEDLNYLVKLGAGSVAGAAAIKYGSIVFPGITQPNLFQALSMITLPVLIAVWLLIRQSNVNSTG